MPANRGASYSYYSSKLIIGTVGSLLIIGPLLISFFFRTSSWKLISTTNNKSKCFIAVAAISALPIMLVHPLNRYNPIKEINRGWINPDANSIKTVINNWDSGPTLYFQFAKSDKLFEFPSSAADRMMNFWSPLFWATTGEYSQFFTWSYLGQTSSDPSILCGLIKSQPITIVTRNPELPALVASSCGPTITKFKIEK
jgi:MFS family permease